MKKKTLSIAALVLAIATLLAGCGGSSPFEKNSAKSSAPSLMADEAAAESAAAYEGDIVDYAYEESYDTTAGAAPAEASGTSNAVTDEQIQSNSNRKLIKTVNMSTETREFDKLIATINERIESLGGYAESFEVNGNSYDTYSERNAFIVARIPANKLDAFVSKVEDESNITSRNESAEDVTLQYADVEAHKESLKIEQKRLNELLEQADKLENIIELENRLTEVRYEIESYESRLRMMNNQVDYSTVNLSIREVKEYTPEPVYEQSFGERIAEGFLDSCEGAWELIQDFIVWFVSILPVLLVILVIVFVIFLIIFGIIKLIISIARKNAKKNEGRKKAKGNKVVATALPNPPENVTEEKKED